MAIGGKCGEQLVHFIFKSHVQHAVRLVEDRHLDAGGVEAAAAQMVEETTGSADDELGAGPQGPELPVNGGTAVDRRGMQALHFRAQPVDFLTDLHCKLTRRAEDQHLRKRQLHIQLRQRRQRKSGRFPRAGRGKPNQVLTQQGRGNAHRLDRRRPLVAERFDGGKQGVGQAEFGERRRVHERM